MKLDALDEKLIAAYPGKVVKKSLLHQIKKGTNVPSFVLEFLLAKFCASEDEEEIEAGKEAVLETIQKNYVRPDEGNKARSTVALKGRHKFIDKVRVNYVEREKRHWAEMENFGSRRIAINERFYKDNERLLEGGIWAEVTLGHNDQEDDDYTFYVEDLRPIQLARFDFDSFCESRTEFTRDEWLDVVIRSIGLDPTPMSCRLKFHYLARLFPFIESNYNFIELGPRGNGKSYTFSEFSPYGTLISGGQTSTSILFYNNQRRRVGIIGFWDVVAFDEVGNMRVRDPQTIQIMKDYMANGRFSRGVEVIANASLAYVGNIDDSIEQLVNSPEHDLFKPLPEAFDLAVLHRMYTFLPGWEVPQASSNSLTSSFAFITDYLAEAMHYLAHKTNRSSYVQSRLKLGSAVIGRDEKAVIKTVSAFVKILHPTGEPTEEEFNEYLEYALEGRRRVKEQLNKRKPDDEFAALDFSYFDSAGEEHVVYCQESEALFKGEKPAAQPVVAQDVDAEVDAMVESPAEPEKAEEEPKEQHFSIHYGARGFGYESLFLDYLRGAETIQIQDPYIRAHHQLVNFQKFCEVAAKAGTVKRIELKTSSDHQEQEDEARGKLYVLADSLKDLDMELVVTWDSHIHDREIKTSNGWTIKIGRGLDYFQKPDDWMSIGVHDLDMRACLETSIDIYKTKINI